MCVATRRSKSERREGNDLLVNAGDRGDRGLLPGRGTLRRVFATGNGFPQAAHHRVERGGIFGFQEA